MKLGILVLFGLTAMLTAYNAQPNKQNKAVINTAKAILAGDTVTELSNNIRVVYQDKKNIYWFGTTEDGLYKYDGKTILQYTTKHGLRFNRIDEIKEDQYGNMYFNCTAPFTVITKFDGAKFYQLYPQKTNNWKFSTTDLWFKPADNKGHVYRFDGVTLHDVQFPRHPKYPNPFEIYSIYNDQKGNTWFGTNPVGVCRYNGKNFDWITETDVTEMHNGPANGVRSIIEDKEGYFWFNSDYRYKIFDSAGASDRIFYKREKSIGSLDGKKDSNLSEYLSIAKDSANNLWIVTYRNGIWKYDGNTVKHFPVLEDGKTVHLLYIYIDHTGIIWLCSQDNGLWKLEKETLTRFKQ